VHFGGAQKAGQNNVGARFSASPSCLMTMIPRENLRLARHEYLGRRIYFVTICTEGRRSIFQDANRATAAIATLRKVSETMNFLVHAFCLVPDHAHILPEGKTPESDLVKFVAQWKQSTGYEFRRELPRRFWQRRFYDHVLRRAEDSDAVAWCIWMNPVRAGIVAEASVYPYSGSFTVEWPKARPAVSAWVPPRKSEEGTR
jgi:putative transposase